MASSVPRTPTNNRHSVICVLEERKSEMTAYQILFVKALKDGNGSLPAPSLDDVVYQLHESSFKVWDPYTVQDDFYTFLEEMPKEVREKVTDMDMDVLHVISGRLLSLFPRLEKLRIGHFIESLEPIKSPCLQKLEIPQGSFLLDIEFLNGAPLNSVTILNACNVPSLHPLGEAPLQFLKITEAMSVDHLDLLKRAVPNLQFDLSRTDGKLDKELRSQLPQAQHIKD